MKRLVTVLAVLAVATCALADTEFFEAKHTSGKTVYFRIFDTSQGAGVNTYTYDFDDDTWETSLGACADPKLAATEKTDMGDGDESVYVASYNLVTIYNTAAGKRFVVQAVDDLATDEVITEGEMWIAAGVRVEPSQLANVTHTVAGITGNITGNLSGSVGSLTTNNDKAGYTLTNLTDASAGKLDDILDGTGAVLTLSQLRINSAAAGGAIDIDNTAGPAISAVTSAGYAIYVDAAVASPAILIAGESNAAIELTGAAGIYANSAIPAQGFLGSMTGNITGNLIGTVSTLTTYTGNTPQTADHTASIAAILADVTGINGDVMRGTDAAALAATALSTAQWTNARAGYLDNLNGHTAQTGDSFARLGAPAGASVSADLAAVKADTAATLTDTGTTGVVVSDLTAAALAEFFTTNSGSTYAASVAGSVVKEIADNAGGGAGSWTAAQIANILSWSEKTFGIVQGGR